MICQICRAAMHRKFTQRGFDIYECGVCRHQTADVEFLADHTERIYTDAYFHGGGAGYPDYLAEHEVLVNHGKRYARLLSRYMKPGTMLDVGAAAGFILKGFISCGWNGQGVEPNPCMAEYARTRVGVDVHVGTLEDFATEERFDLVSMIQVVAHFVDLHSAFAAARNRTASGGFLLIETWNKDSLTARLFGRRWHEYSPPSVVHWFSPSGLTRLCESVGFAEVARGKPTKWLNGAHAQSLLRHTLEPHAWGRVAARATRLIPQRLPIPYPAEDLFWILYRKS
ncbi:MAG: class I SAM-dependent methyltransferase [Pyrinomonadaceae bacterium]|nr:class I SAM-dependent methyltransferase [Pyrinomonadaceae bacterium]